MHKYDILHIHDIQTDDCKHEPTMYTNSLCTYVQRVNHDGQAVALGVEEVLVVVAAVVSGELDHFIIQKDE